MIGAKRSANLTWKNGPNTGKEIALKGPQFSLGSDAKCDLVIQGRFVSETHVTLVQRRDSRWELNNQSINGTLVNGTPGNKLMLSNGDVITVGQDAVFEFKIAKAEKPAPPAIKPRPRKRPSETEEEPEVDADEARQKKKIKGKQVVIGTGLGVYLVAMIGVFVFLAGYEGKSNAAKPLSLATLETVMKVTSAEVQGKTLDKGVRCPVEQGHAAFKYPDTRVVASLDTHTLPSLEEGEDAIQQTLAAISAEFQSAWSLEMQGHFQDSLAHYRSVLSYLPSISFCSSRYAAERIRKTSDAKK